jgi:hypothetical protein
MLSKITLVELQFELLERQSGRRPFEWIIEPAPEIAINKQLLAEQCHQVTPTIRRSISVSASGSEA